MIAESVSLGVLSLPQTLAQLGLAPAVVLIIGLGILATYTGYVIAQFRERYPHIQNLADAGEVLLGPFGRELFGIGQLLFSIFIMGSHILTFSVMMNTVTEHGTCTMVFTTVGFVICMVCSLPRTMKNMTYISCFCKHFTTPKDIPILTHPAFVSIFTAVMITMIGVAVQDHGYTTLKATVETDLFHAFTAVTNIVFAYCAHVAFFGLLAEMREPKDFPKALCMLQTFEIVFYTVAAVVIYYYAGQDVTSPALGSAGPLLAKIAYGIAIPTVRPALSQRGSKSQPDTNMFYADHRRRRRKRARRPKIHLRPALPRHRPHAQTRPLLHRLLGRYRSVLLDHRMDYRRCHPGIHRPAQSNQLTVRELVQLRS